MALTITACTGVALVAGPRYPFAAALFTAGILAASSALLPAPAWSWWLRAAGHMIPRRVKRACRVAVPVIVREPKGPRRAERTKRARRREWHERLYFGLSRAEWDSRVQIGMSLWHTERLAYDLPNAEEWDDLEVWIWPDGWVHVIEEFRREQGWRQA